MKYLNGVIIVALLLNVNCWLYIADTTFPATKTLDVKQADKPSVYIGDIGFSTTPAKSGEKNKQMFEKKYLKELNQACSSFAAFEFIKNEGEADYVITFDFHIIDRSLAPIAGLGIIPIPGYIYCICNASIYSKDKKLLKRYQYLDTKCVVPHWLFLPLMFTPLPYNGKSYTATLDKMITLTFNTIVEEDVFSYKSE